MKRGDAPSRAVGAALLEVVLALAIFFITAMFVMDALNSSLRAVGRAQLEADAEDLAVTVLSEVQMGMLQIKSEPPAPFHEELFPGWTWELVVTGIEDLANIPVLRRVEVIVRNEPQRFTHRVSQLVWDDPAERTDTVMNELNLNIENAAVEAAN